MVTEYNCRKFSFSLCRSLFRFNNCRFCRNRFRVIQKWLHINREGAQRPRASKLRMPGDMLASPLATTPCERSPAHSRRMATPSRRTRSLTGRGSSRRVDQRPAFDVSLPREDAPVSPSPRTPVDRRSKIPVGLWDFPTLCHPQSACHGGNSAPHLIAASWYTVGTAPSRQVKTRRRSTRARTTLSQPADVH